MARYRRRKVLRQGTAGDRGKRPGFRYGPLRPAGPGADRGPGWLPDRGQWLPSGRWPCRSALGGDAPHPGAGPAGGPAEGLATTLAGGPPPEFLCTKGTRVGRSYPTSLPFPNCTSLPSKLQGGYRCFRCPARFDVPGTSGKERAHWGAWRRAAWAAASRAMGTRKGEQLT